MPGMWVILQSKSKDHGRRLPRGHKEHQKRYWRSKKNKMPVAGGNQEPAWCRWPARGAFQSPLSLAKASGIRLTLSLCIYHLCCKYIQMPCEIFINFGKFYRRLLRQKKLMYTIELSWQSPLKPWRSLHYGFSMYSILVFMLRTILLLENRTKFCSQIENHNREHTCPQSNQIVWFSNLTVEIICEYSCANCSVLLTSAGRYKQKNGSRD